jgi:NAD-dependent dihydropyrimidine dehydrogenase PreA subunit
MIKKIDPKTCTGCGLCVDVCPTDVLRIDEGSRKAVIRYQENCMTCYNCELECPCDSIFVDPFRKATQPIISYLKGGR